MAVDVWREKKKKKVLQQKTSFNRLSFRTMINLTARCVCRPWTKMMLSFYHQLRSVYNFFKKKTNKNQWLKTIASIRILTNVLWNRLARLAPLLPKKLEPTARVLFMLLVGQTRTKTRPKNCSHNCAGLVGT